MALASDQPGIGNSCYLKHLLHVHRNIIYIHVGIEGLSIRVLVIQELDTDGLARILRQIDAPLEPAPAVRDLVEELLNDIKSV